MWTRRSRSALLCSLLYPASFFCVQDVQAAAQGDDVAGVVGRSDIVLQRPNLQAAEAMPLGNAALELPFGPKTD